MIFEVISNKYWLKFWIKCKTPDKPLWVFIFFLSRQKLDLQSVNQNIHSKKNIFVFQFASIMLIISWPQNNGIASVKFLLLLSCTRDSKSVLKGSFVVKNNVHNKCHTVSHTYEFRMVVRVVKFIFVATRHPSVCKKMMNSDVCN